MMNQCEMSEFSTPELAFKYLQDRGLLRRQAPECTTAECRRLMTLIRQGRNDSIVWRCPSHKAIKRSVTAGSFLERQNLPFNIFLLLAYHWAYPTPVTLAKEYVPVSRVTAIMWYQYFRDVCTQWLQHNPLMLGGPGHVVQINESLMQKKNKKMGQVASQRWIFAMYDVHQRLGYLHLVKEMDKETVLPFILQHVLPGTEIHSNDEAIYMGAISALPMVPPYIHQVVHYVDPLTDVYANNVESFLKNFKSELSKMRGMLNKYLSSYMNEFMWRQLYGRKGIEAFDNILNQLAHYCPVM